MLNTHWTLLSGVELKTTEDLKLQFDFVVSKLYM